MIELVLLDVVYIECVTLLCAGQAVGICTALLDSRKPYC
jgi:hypothetical protein